MLPALPKCADGEEVSDCGECGKSKCGGDCSWCAAAQTCLDKSGGACGDSEYFLGLYLIGKK